jgi:predicted double-glycine peptidase
MPSKKLLEPAFLIFALLWGTFSANTSEPASANAGEERYVRNGETLIANASEPSSTNASEPSSTNASEPSSTNASEPSSTGASEPSAEPGSKRVSVKTVPSGKAGSAHALPANLIKIPMTRQATNYTCGVAALQSVFAYFGEDFREDALARRLKADRNEGTSYKRMRKLARSKGYTVDVKTGMTLQNLKGLIDRKKPVICLIQAWPDKKVNYKTDWEDGHYVVAIGYDANDFYFMDPSTLGYYTYIPIKEFLDRWHDTDSKAKLFNFGMVVEKPTSNYDQSIARKLE